MANHQHGPKDEWPADLTRQLRELWPDLSLSTAEIARRLGVSKAAVNGKTKRLHLPARPSPIRKGLAKGSRQRGALVSTLPPLGSLS
jgi:hypothetical protein